MSHVPHELAEEFPEHAEAIHRLRQTDRRFEALCEQYHQVNRDIHRIEAEVEPSSDEQLETLKKRRLQMADEVRAALEKV
jgi:uncharacterized protein YdcH (DUF465 family)